MRQRYLKVIFEQLKPLHQANANEAAVKAAEHEKSVYDRAKSKAIYVNLVANLIKSLRTQVVEKQHQQGSSSQQQSQNNGKSPSLVTSPTSSFSHEAILSGPKATRVNYAIGRTKSVEIKDLSGLDWIKDFF